MVLRANRSSCSPRPALAASIFCSISATVRRTPAARTTPSRRTSSPTTSIWSPSSMRVEDLAAHVVDERDAAASQQQRPDVGIGARDGRSGVDDDLDAGRDERLGAHAVHVDVVDDRDVVGTEPLDEVLGPLVELRGALVAHASPVSVGDRRMRSRVGTVAATGASIAGRVPRAKPARGLSSGPSEALSGRRAPRAARGRGPGSPPSRCPRACARSRSRDRVPRRFARPWSRRRSDRLFSTTSCASANAATCARCVTTMTWCVLRELAQAAGPRRAPSRRRCRRRPRRRPASRTVSASPRTPLSASITRESSPPEAIRASGRAG